ncbi:MAG: SRPBCC family protein [Bacteroidia bacterium]|nr:SRPBCC family protein [Bacteroidia bacterium]
MNNIDDQELKMSRLLNAPIELVWKVWTEPEHIAQWWGPNGFTNTIYTMDIKPGGEWKFVMHGPDGKDYNNRSIFREIIKHERIVFEHFNPNFITTVMFKPEGNKTMLYWQMTFEKPEELQTVIKVFKADNGMKENVEKLENYLFNQLK